MNGSQIPTAPLPNGPLPQLGGTRAETGKARAQVPALVVLMQLMTGVFLPLALLATGIGLVFLEGSAATRAAGAVISAAAVAAIFFVSRRVIHGPSVARALGLFVLIIGGFWGFCGALLLLA